MPAGSPDITQVQHQGIVKYGFGLNAEQELTSFAASLRPLGME